MDVNPKYWFCGVKEETAIHKFCNSDTVEREKIHFGNGIHRGALLWSRGQLGPIPIFEERVHLVFDE